MSSLRTYSQAFTGGELTPEFFGRIDDPKYQSGLAMCRNFVVLPHGPVANRAGTEFVREVKVTTSKVRLLPFTYSTDQTFAIEFGAGYFRFHTQGATLMNGSVPFEVPNNYLEADLFDVHYVQSADVLTLVHPKYPPRELRRRGALDWVLADIDFSPTSQKPTGVTATATTGTGTTEYKYAVTSVGENGLDESLLSNSATCTNNLLTTGNLNTITWTAVAGAKRYNVYQEVSGLFGYIGQTAGLAFKDNNIAADMGKTPLEAQNPFVGAGNYPGAVSYFEQRRAFAGTLNKPQTLWLTRTGTESNLAYSIPTRADDGINIRVAAREANTIRHLVPLNALVLLTSSAEWRASSIDSGALTPTTIAVKTQSYVGANNVQPVLVNTTLLYPAARGGHLRELAYNWQASGYITGDTCLRSPHLFDRFNLVDMAYAKSPQPIVWCVSSSGKLLGLTYIPEQQIGAWHQHDTVNGRFESVCAVAEENDDAVYVIVQRNIGGVYRRFIERFNTRVFDLLEDAFFVDSGLTYRGPEISTVTGLTYLDGQTVSILADGAVHPQQVVTGGSITLEQPARVITIGLPITADLQTLPFSAQIAGFGQGRPKNVNKLWMRVYRSSGIFAGPSFEKLTEVKQRTTEPYGTPPRLKSDEVNVMVTPSWTDNGQLCIRQSDPLPLTVLSVSMEVALGG